MDEKCLQKYLDKAEASSANPNMRRVPTKTSMRSMDSRHSAPSDMITETTMPTAR